jgi:hypothetical protein
MENLKEFMSFDELQELEESGDYTTEDNGMSGQYNGYHWYSITNDATGEIKDIYVK